MNIVPIIGIGAIFAGTLVFFYHKGKSFEKHPITYEQFTEQLSRQIDTYMLNEEKKKGVIMCGGECTIRIPESDPENVVMEIVLYSKKNGNDDRWIKSNITQKLAVNEFADDENTKSKIEFLKHNSENFKVSTPEKE